MVREPFDVWSPRFRSVSGRFAAIPVAAMQAGAKRMEARAKAYAPVDTGELRASITAQLEGRGTGRSVIGRRLFLTAPRKYAPIEFGSRRGHVAQRFLERGMHEELDALEREVGDDLEGAFLGRLGHIGPRFSTVVR